jgi:outer membrane translocation and assembly module TamA
MGLVYDNRKNVMNVREGLFAELAFLSYSPSLGSTNSFRSTQFDLRYFRKGINPGDVLALQGSALLNKGDAPFNQMAMMGGESMMRGYYLGRFRDKNMLATQAEYRFLPFVFSKRWGAAAFVSGATVAPTAKNLLSSQFKMAGGIGARYLIFKSKDIFVRFDVAFTREGNGYYFYIGEAF